MKKKCTTFSKKMYIISMEKMSKKSKILCLIILNIVIFMFEIYVIKKYLFNDEFNLSSKKEKEVATPERIGGSLYAKKYIPKKEYDKKIEEKNRMEKEYLKTQEKKRQEVLEWGKNFEQTRFEKKRLEKEKIENDNTQINGFDYNKRSTYYNDFNIEKQKEFDKANTKPQKKLVYKARGVKIYESN